MSGRRRDRRSAWRDPGTCPRCGDPLPLDGQCDCAGDVDRDERTAYRGGIAHCVLVRLGPAVRDRRLDARGRRGRAGGGYGSGSDEQPDDSIVEVWL